MSLPHDPPSVQQFVDDLNLFSQIQRELILLLGLVGFDGDVQLTCRNIPTHWEACSSAGKSKPGAQLAFVVWFRFLWLFWAVQRLQVGRGNPASFGVNLAEPPTWTAEAKQLTLALIYMTNTEVLGPVSNRLTVLVLLHNLHLVSGKQINFIFGRFGVVSNHSVHVQNDGARDFWVVKQINHIIIEKC